MKWWQRNLHFELSAATLEALGWALCFLGPSLWLVSMFPSATLCFFPPEVCIAEYSTSKQFIVIVTAIDHGNFMSKPTMYVII